MDVLSNNWWFLSIAVEANPAKLAASAVIASKVSCALAGPIEELPWPPFSVILVSQDVGTTPGPGVCLHLRALASARLRAADVARLRTQRRAALLRHEVVHGHADPGKLRPDPRQDSTAQATEQKPPSKGAHRFIMGRTLAFLTSILFSSRLPLLSIHSVSIFGFREGFFLYIFGLRSSSSPL